MLMHHMPHLEQRMRLVLRRLHIRPRPTPARDQDESEATHARTIDFHGARILEFPSFLKISAP